METDSGLASVRIGSIKWELKSEEAFFYDVYYRLERGHGEMETLYSMGCLYVVLIGELLTVLHTCSALGLLGKRFQ